MGNHTLSHFLLQKLEFKSSQFFGARNVEEAEDGALLSLIDKLLAAHLDLLYDWLVCLCQSAILVLLLELDCDEFRGAGGHCIL